MAITHAVLCEGVEIIKRYDSLLDHIFLSIILDDVLSFLLNINLCPNGLTCVSLAMAARTRMRPGLLRFYFRKFYSW